MPQMIIDLLHKGYNSWNQPSTLLEVGIELESRSRLSDARTFLNRVLELDSKNFPEAYVSLAYSYMRDYRTEDGELSFTNGIEETDSGYIKACYISILEDKTIEEQFINWCSQQKDASILMGLGSSLIWKGMYEDALYFSRLGIKLADLTTIPLGLSDYCFTMLWLYTHKHEIDLEKEVFPYIQLLLQHKPLCYNYHNFMLNYYQNIQNWEKVIEQSLSMLDLFPDEETTMVAIAIGYSKTNNDQSAIHWLSRAIGAKPSFIRARRQLASIYERLGNVDLAVEIMRQIPKANPANGMGYLFTAGFIFKHNINLKEEADSLFLKGYSLLPEFEKGSLDRFEDLKPFLPLILKK